MGNAPAHKLFERVTIERNDPATPPRSFADYTVQVNEAEMPTGVTLLRMV